MTKYLFLLLSIFISLPSFSASFSKGSRGIPHTVNGNSATMGSGVTSAMPSGSSSPSFQSSPIGNSGWWTGTATGPATGPTMTMGMNGDVFIAGTKYPFQAGYKVTPTDLAGAAVSLVGGGWGVALGVALAAYPHLSSWLSDNGASINPDATGADDAWMVPGSSTTSDGYQYSCNPSWTVYDRQYASCTPQEVCRKMGQPYVSKNHNGRPACGSAGGNELAMIGPNIGVNVPPGEPYSTQRALYQAAARAWQAGNFPSSNVFNEIYQNGGSVEISEPSFSGPTQISSPPVTTTTSGTDASGSPTSKSETTVVTNHYTWNDNKVTNTHKTTTTTTVSTNLSSGVSTTETSTKTEQKEDTDPVVDTPLPDLPDLYQQKYPDGLKGVVSQKISQLKQTPLFKLPSDLMGNLPSSGECPSWQLDLNLSSWAPLGVYNVGADCNIWQFASLVVLIGALILCRALIFGG